MSTRKTRSTIQTDSVSGRTAGISSTRPTRPKTRVNIGATPSATTSSTGRICPTPSTPTRRNAVFRARRWSRDERVIAIYHGTKVGNMVAVSHDPLLLNWEKLTGAPGHSHRQRGRLAAALPGLRSLHLEERGPLLRPFRRHPAPRSLRQAHARQLPLSLAEPGRLGLSAPVRGR